MLTLESGLMTCYYTINGVTLGMSSMPYTPSQSEENNIFK